MQIERSASGNGDGGHDALKNYGAAFRISVGYLIFFTHLFHSSSLLISAPLPYDLQRYQRDLEAERCDYDQMRVRPRTHDS